MHAASVKIHSLSIGLFDHAVTCAVVKVQKAKGLGVRGFGLAALFNPVIIIVRDRDVNLYCIDDNGPAFLKIKQRRGDRLIGRFQYRLARLVKRHIFVRETAHINFRRFIYQFSYALLRLPILPSHIQNPVFGARQKCRVARRIEISYKIGLSLKMSTC